MDNKIEINEHNKIIINVSDFENNDSYSLSSQTHNNEEWAHDIITDLSFPQGVPTQDVNICAQSENQTANCLTSDLLSEQVFSLDEDFPHDLPPLDESVLNSLRNMIDNENTINDDSIPGQNLLGLGFAGSGDSVPGQNYLGLGFAEAAGLKEVNRLARANTEQLDPNCIGWNAPMHSTNVMDWGIPQENPEPLHPNCPIIRRIIHSNGIQESKLEIHELDGQPDHAIYERRPCVRDEMLPGMEPQTFKLQDMEKFIRWYNDKRSLDGSVLRHDTLTATKSGPSACGTNPSVLQTNAVKKPANPSYFPKVDLSVQRKRTKTIDITAFAPFFHKPIVEAAKDLQLCPTFIKNLCRRYELLRWPFRKINSIQSQIQKLESKLVGENGEINESIKTKIEELRNDKENLYKSLLSKTKKTR